MSTTYIIVGTIESECIQYWNVDLNKWVLGYHNASHFPIDILNLPPPIGATSIMEVSIDGKPVSYWPLLQERGDNDNLQNFPEWC